MSWRPALKAMSRLALVLSIALSGIALAVENAEARRGGRVRTFNERATNHDDASVRRTSDDDDSAQGADGPSGTHIPHVRSREPARGGAETTAARDGLLTARRVPTGRAMSTRPVQDIDVPGCPAGMICTVCLAGCSGDVGGIVDAQSKTLAPATRR